MKSNFLKNNYKYQMLQFAKYNILSTFLITSKGLIDSLFLGQISHEQLIAFGLCFPFILFVTSTSQSFSMSVTALCSACFVPSHPKYNDFTSIYKSITFAVFMSVIVIFILIVCSITIKSTFSSERWLLTANFLIIYLFTVPFLNINTVLRTVLRNLGLEKQASLISLISFVISVIISYVLVFGKLNFSSIGIYGVALSMLTGIIINTLLLTILLKKNTKIIFTLNKIDIKFMKNIIKISLPSLTSNGLAIFFISSLIFLFSQISDISSAGFAIVIRIEQVILIIIGSIVSSYIPFFLINKKDKNHEIIYKGLLVIMKRILIAGLTIMIICILINELLIEAFITNDVELKAFINYFLIIMPIGYIGQAFFILYSLLMIVEKRGNIIVMINVIRFLILGIPIIYFIIDRYYELGGFIVLSMLNIIFGILGYIYTIKYVKKL